jgi:hypothetical protein
MRKKLNQNALKCYRETKTGSKENASFQSILSLVLLSQACPSYSSDTLKTQCQVGFKESSFPSRDSHNSRLPSMNVCIA